MTPTAHDIVDLTDDPDPPQDDNDVEEVMVRSLPPGTQRARLGQRRTRPFGWTRIPSRQSGSNGHQPSEPSGQSSENDIEVVGSHQLTTEERTERLRRRLLRPGMPVLGRPNTTMNARPYINTRWPPIRPRTEWSQGRYNQRSQIYTAHPEDDGAWRTADGSHDDDSMPLDVLDFLASVEESHEFGSAGHTGPGAGSHAEIANLLREQRRIVERRIASQRQHAISLRNFPVHNEDLSMAIANSLLETDNHKPPDLSSLKLPKKPEQVREGFTNSATNNAKCVCAACENELGIGDSSLPETARALSARIYYRSCGHVYCGQCVHLIKVGDSPFRGCAVVGCKSGRTKFCQIYH